MMVKFPSISLRLLSSSSSPVNTGSEVLRYYTHPHSRHTSPVTEKTHKFRRFPICSQMIPSSLSMHHPASNLQSWGGLEPSGDFDATLNPHKVVAKPA
ncbi:hypothetical protein IAQ61_008383 [Plenodomus lingam]|uniref:uncharacterized protein n=1 Tax=Leptosphaeria maculans TaxID=5022 RepID=UPI00331F4D4A|nr:hypothetical protein IAQ61_008383 [Plenodomus lingam]